MSDPLPTDQSLGEGFAFFRWHCLAFPWSNCAGINDRSPGCGIETCVPEWRSLHVHETESAIRGNGYGSTHVWKRGYTGANRVTPYQCKKCGVWFNHHYPSTPNIFEAMAKAGVPEVCASVTALKHVKP